MEKNPLYAIFEAIAISAGATARSAEIHQALAKLQTNIYATHNQMLKLREGVLNSIKQIDVAAGYIADSCQIVKDAEDLMIAADTALNASKHAALIEMYREGCPPDCSHLQPDRCINQAVTDALVVIHDNTARIAEAIAIDKNKANHEILRAHTDRIRFQEHIGAAVRNTIAAANLRATTARSRAAAAALAASAASRAASRSRCRRAGRIRCHQGVPRQSRRRRRSQRIAE